MSYRIKNYILLLITILAFPAMLNSQLMHVNGNSTFHLMNGAIVQINGGLSIASGATVSHNPGATSYLYISGRFQLYGTYSQDANGRITFNKGLQDTLGGNSSITIARIYIDKSNNNTVVLDPATDLSISEYLMLLNSSLELVNSDLILPAWAKIYSNVGLDTNLTTFNANKCILNSGSSSDPLLGGRVIRRFPNTLTLPQDFNFPIGTPGFYSPAKLTLRTGGATFGTNPEINIKAVDQEHPKVEVNDKSLTKYWSVNTNDVAIGASGVNVEFYYNASEVAGNESNYRVLYFSPSYNDPNGFWRVDPGNDNDIVDFNQRFFYSIKVDSIKGDWTAGEPEVSEATYYSRQNGNYNDPNTWSKIGFGGVASTTAPNKQSDRVRIKNDTVTVTTQPFGVRLISVENDVNPGMLVIQDNYYMSGDSALVEDNATLSFANSDGVAALPANTGCIRTSIRSLSSNGIYMFSGSGNQNSGNGLPSIAKGIIVQKSALTDTVTLQKNIAVSSYFNVIQGTFDVSSYTIDGATSGKTFSMSGGEIILRASFLNNYTSPTLMAGKVTFNGSGNSVIPSSTSTPGVLQYNDLKIAGTSRAGNITFPNNGEIKIKNELDISNLNFTSNTFKFLTDGSTVRFNKNSGIQNIPLKIASPVDTLVYLEYYNLILDSAGTKQLSATGSPTFKVLNNLTLNNSVTFSSNNQNLEVQGNWLNQNGSTFSAGNSTVIMRSTVSLVTKSITSRDTTANTFNNLLIAGPGIVQSLDKIKVAGNLKIDTTSSFNLNSNLLSLYGNWINQGGTHVIGTSTVRFSNTVQQNIINTSSNSKFYNLVIDNASNVNASTVGGTSNGVIISNDLTLKNGNLLTHSGANYRYATVLGILTRPGSGYVDGELRKNIPTGVTTINYEVGFNYSYTPVSLSFTGTGGTAGLLGVLSDTLGVGTTPISWTDATPSDISPVGTSLSMSNHIARQFKVGVPSGSLFILGAGREYSINTTFIPGASPNGDIRNGADYTKFSGRLWNGSNWITPFYYGTKPVIGTLTSSTFEYTQLKDFGTLIFGEPGMALYYTRANGNWDVATNWSVQGYGGTASTTYPGEMHNNYKVLIGNNNTINMTANRTITNITGDSAYVQVDSSGRLNMENFVLSGNGAFRLKKNSTLGIGNSAGIVTAPTASGNIQTGTRNYNYGSHNLGSFIYNSTGIQSTGNGLPSGADSILKIIINKPSGVLTINSTSSLHVKDSLYIQSGDFNLGTQDLYAYKNLRKSSGSSLVPNGRTVYLRGEDEIYIRSENYSEPFSFYNLRIGKAINTGDIFLDTLTVLDISNNLTYEAGNKSRIDATQKSSEIKPLYVQFGSSATVTGAGHIDFTYSGGWVYGEVRKNIPAGDAPAVTFETGTSLYYSPYQIDFANAAGSVAGYLSAKAIAGNHPKLYNSPSNLYPINPSRNITVYWQLKKPNGSTFDRGLRNANYRVYLVNPDQQINTDCFNCADLAYYRGGDSLQWWQSMALNNGGENSNNGNGTCSDTRIAPHPTPSFTYSGDNCSVTPLVFIQVNGVPSTVALGSTDFFSNGDLLLGDFVAGNRNSVKYYNFFSIKDGDWSDPTTWSTESYSGTINAAALDADPLIRPVPMRQYDNVYIGNGKKVKLDMFVGTNRLSSDPNANGFAGPSVFVEDSGILDLQTSVLRGNQFNSKKGSTLIIGSNDGITTTNLGNVQGASYASLPKYNDSIKVEYAPNGLTSNGQTRDLVNRNSTTHYIESITIRKTSDNSIVMQHTTGNKYLLATYGNYRANASCSLQIGQQYYIQINPSNSATNRKYKAWSDYNFNYDFTNGGEELFNLNSADTVLITSANFTIPAANEQGTTTLRIGMRSDNNDFTPTEGGGAAGEFEDYTIYIQNTSYVANQVTGSGLPNLLQSFTVHSLNPAASNPQVTLGKSIVVIDDLNFLSGRFFQGANTIDLYGNILHDTLNGYNAISTSNINLLGSLIQNINGSDSILFNNLTVNKTGSNSVNLNTNATIDGILTFSTNNNLVLNTNNTLTFNTQATVSSGAGNFSSGRMIEVDGSSNISYVSKKFLPNPLVPSYCTPGLAIGGQYINRVRFSNGVTFNNQVDVSSGYADYTSLVIPTITAGSPIRFRGYRNNNSGTRYWRVWIDYDQDGILEASEVVTSGTTPNGSATYSDAAFTIPITAYNGSTRMRVMMRNTSDPNNPCEVSSTQGEFEDYTVTISGGTDAPTLKSNIAFLFPLGTNSIYNPANFVLTANFNPTSSIGVLLKDELHPQRLIGGLFADDVLDKYWKIQTTGISDVIADSLYFQYDDTDVNGDESKYIPARYTSSWEINLGTLPKVQDNKLRIYPTLVDTLISLDGDWTAGDPQSFFYGRKFYSIQTGDWNDHTSWSNISHTGARSQYFPGDIFYQDTVLIDGYNITFKDSVNIKIDSLHIGLTNVNPGQGILTFGLSPADKSLTLRQIAVEEDGLITGLTGGGRQDTIKITGNLLNNSSANVSFRNDNTHATHLKFIDTSNSKIYGTGNFGRLGDVILEKTGGLEDTLFVEAANFAIASDTTTNYTVKFNSGFLSHKVNTDLYLSTGSNDIVMDDSTGIEVLNGSVRTRSTIISNFNTQFTLDGGDFIVGDGVNENFLYKTGTTFNIINGDFIVAAAFARALPTSLVDFTSTGANDIMVNTIGNTDPTNIGFDVSNAASSFSMNNGRIIIANAGGTTPGPADYSVSAQNGTGMIGGTLQSGDTLLTPNSSTIKIAGTLPVHNLHFVNAPLNAVQSQITESIFTIANDWTIDANHSFNLDGNTVKLAGNLTNYGNFNAVPSGPTSSPWQIEFNGASNQNLLSDLTAFEVYKISINKSAGNVILSPSGNSDLIIRNTLEFSTTNQSYIDASALNRFVELSPTVDSDPSVFRLGLGHVFGRLYRYIPTDQAIVQYPIGADTITSYRPLTFQTVGVGGTAGLVGARHYPVVHPDTVGAPFVTTNNILKYWNVDDPGAFDLDTRTFNITLQFINPADLNGSSTLANEMYLYNPPYPAVGAWTELSSPFKSDTTIRSTNNTLYGDFAIGEPNGLTFYSYNNGSWNDINTWSLGGYTTLVVPSREPNDKTDIVRIGNGKAVTLPDNYNDTLKTVIVERFNGLPGELYIQGTLNFFRGNNFILEDSCTLGIMHINGITNPSQGNSGAIQTTARAYGVSRYVYNSNFGSIATGLGMPDSVKTIVINAPNTINKTVFLSNQASLPVKIQDTLSIQQGEFSTNSRFIELNKVLILDTIVNNGRLIPGTGKFLFPNNNDKYIILKNRSGARFYDLEILGGDVIVNRPSAPLPDSGHIYVNNVMNFNSANSKFEINDNVNLVIRNSAVNAMQNYSINNFVRIGDVGGYLIRNVSPSLSYDFPIGVDNDYNYATFDGLTGSTGYLGIRVDRGSMANFAHLGSSGIPSSEFLQTYWSVDSVRLQINGKLRFYYNDADITGTETNLAKIGRWNPVREVTPGIWTFPFAVPSINYALNYFETSSSFAYSEFAGDWALGNDIYFRRIFFSRQNGDWNDANTWTYNPTHIGPIFGPGIYPNFSSDSVQIGGGSNGVNNHIVVLNVNNPFSSPATVGIALGTGTNNTGTLDLGTNTLNGNIFNMNDLSTLIIGSTDGISTLGNATGGVQTDVVRNFHLNGIYHYRGIVNQITGNGLPAGINSLIVENLGPVGNYTLTLGNNLDIVDSLTIRSGRLDIGNNQVNTSSLVAHFRINDDAVLALGGTSNMLSAVNSYQSYLIDQNSYLEFYGNNQVISDLPLSLTQSFLSDTGGFGNVITTNNGTKYVNSALLIRGNLINQNLSNLTIDDAINSVRVIGSVINSAAIFNQGIIEIGN